MKWRQAKHNAASWIQAAIEIKKENIHYWYIICLPNGHIKKSKPKNKNYKLIFY